jgi:hypothetical protein
MRRLLSSQRLWSSNQDYRFESSLRSYPINPSRLFAKGGPGGPIAPWRPRPHAARVRNEISPSPHSRAPTQARREDRSDNCSSASPRVPPPDPASPDSDAYTAVSPPASSPVRTLKCGFSCGIDRVLLRPADPDKDCALAEQVPEQRIVIEHVQRTRIRRQALFEAGDKASQARLRQWIEEIEYEWLSGKNKLASVRADRFDLRAALGRGMVGANVLLRRAMQLRQSTPLPQFFRNGYSEAISSVRPLPDPRSTNVNVIERDRAGSPSSRETKTVPSADTGNEINPAARARQPTVPLVVLTRCSQSYSMSP